MPEKIVYRSHLIRGRRGIGFGVFVLVVGILWLLSELGYLPNLPFWPVAVILLGLFLIFG